MDETQIDDLIDRAFHLVEIARYEEAMKLFGEVVAVQQEHTWALLGIARCLAHLGDKKECHRLSLQAARTNLWQPSMWTFHCSTLDIAGYTAEALAVARTAVQLFPDHAEVHVQLAYSAADSKKKAEAFEAGEMAIALAPDDASTYVAYTYVASKFRKWKVAESAARSALAIDPHSAPALNNLAVALHAQRKRREAMEISSDLAASAPGDEVLVENARGQMWRYALVPTIGIVHALTSLIVRHSGSFPIAIAIIGLLTLMYGLFITLRLRRLSGSQRVVTTRVWKSSRFGALLAEPRYLVGAGMVMMTFPLAFG